MIFFLKSTKVTTNTNQILRPNRSQKIPSINNIGSVLTYSPKPLEPSLIQKLMFQLCKGVAYGIHSCVRAYTLIWILLRKKMFYNWRALLHMYNSSLTFGPFLMFHYALPVLSLIWNQQQNLSVVKDKELLQIADLGLSLYLLKSYTHENVTLWYRAPYVLLGSDSLFNCCFMWFAGCFSGW